MSKVFRMSIGLSTLVYQDLARYLRYQDGKRACSLPELARCFWTADRNAAITLRMVLSSSLWHVEKPRHHRHQILQAFRQHSLQTPQSAFIARLMPKYFVPDA